MMVKLTSDLGLKTNKGGLKHRKLDAKVVEVYQINDVLRCPVHIIQTYLAKLPKQRNCPSFYLQPHCKFTSNSWFLDYPVGINTLQCVVKNVCDKAKLSGFYTRMYRNDTEEQVIQEVMGQRLLTVRSYKHTSTQQKKMAIKSLASQN